MVEVLTIETDEEVEQVQARLARARSRHVYLYLPRPNPALRQRLQLTRLRRTAEDLGLNLTIVTGDSATRAMAGYVGLRAGWRLPKGRAGRPEPGGAGSRLPTLHSTLSVVVSAGVLLLLGLALAGLVLPQATIVVTPLTTPLDTVLEILADPDVPAPDIAGSRMPARRLEVTLDREAREPTLARSDVPDRPARGTVVFVNQSEGEVVVPAGSRVTTSGGEAVSFRTLEAVTLPGPAGTRARVPVEAAEAGLQGNVPAYTVSVLEAGLGLPVAVVNDRPMSGGTVRRVGVVTQAERDRVRDALLERTRAEALAALRAQVLAGEILPDGSVQVQVLQESFSEEAEAVADVISVGLTLRAGGTAVDVSAARALAADMLRSAVPAGQSLVAETLVAEAVSVTGAEAGLVRVQMRAMATLQTELSAREIRYAVRGRPVDEAMAILRERFPLMGAPVIFVSRGWLGRMPWLPMRIDVIIRDSSTLIGEVEGHETNHVAGRG